ncbi:MAG: hypothetical protein LBK99_27440 [Opitutaceae bacterium]|jgi:hypothetical protein|nr:hypothetical protein [Opitutaceae bacterium]
MTTETAANLLGDAEESPTARPRAARRARYAYPLEHYTKIHPVSLRTLKGWIAIGRDADPPDLPPLDAPERLKDWYSLHKKNRVPDWIVSLAARPGSIENSGTSGTPHTAESPPPDPSAGPLFAAAAHAAATSPGASPPPPPYPADVTQLGYDATLNRLRIAEQAAGQKYATLLHKSVTDASKEAEAEQARRAWQNIVKEMRAYEKDAQQVLQASGKSWNADAVMATIEAFQIIQKAGMVNLVRRVRPLLKTCKTDIEQDALWQRETDKIFAAWNETGFTAQVTGASNVST